MNRPPERTMAAWVDPAGGSQEPGAGDDLASRDPQALLEELRVHQVELELQAQALRASEEIAQGQARLYQHLLAEVPVALLRLDHQGRITSANRSAERLFGQASPLLEGRYLFRFGADEQDRKALLQAIQLGILRDRYESHRHHFELHGNRWVLDLHMSRVPGNGGGTGEWLLSLVDQTQVAREQAQLKATLEDLREAMVLNRDLATVADRMPSMVAVCDADERVLWVNPRFLEVTGWPADQLQGLPLLDSLQLQAAGATPAITLAALRPCWRADQGVHKHRLSLQTATGRRLWAEVNLLVVQDQLGQVQRRIFIAEDVSEQVQLQADREATLEQQALHTVQSDFLSRMSHNMRTPLNAILGFSQLLTISTAGKITEEDRLRLRILNDAGLQLLHMVDQALTLVQLDYQREAHELGPVDLPQVIEDVVLLLADRAAARQIQVVIDVPAGARVHGHVQLVQEIASNLLSNAIKYSQEGQQVRLSAERVGEGELALRVADVGIGIPEGAMTQLFRPFSRLENGRGMASGHGLGLAISLQQAQFMGGRIDVRTCLGEGSTFSLVLPLDNSPIADVPLPPDTLGILATVPPLVMVYVEDDPINQALLEAAMQMAPQVQLHMAGTVKEGMAAIARHQPDVVLLDINLPDGSGVDMCLDLSADPAHRPPMILALSADALPEHVRQAMDAGFDHYLAKPVEFDGLFTCMARLTPRSRSASV
jgi:PAS domain S-box-containing protein